MTYLKIKELLMKKDYKEFSKEPNMYYFEKDCGDYFLGIEIMKNRQINPIYFLKDFFVGSNYSGTDAYIRSEEELPDFKKGLDEVNNDCRELINAGCDYITHRTKVGK